MVDDEELNARIERAEHTLSFYVLYEEELKKGYSKEKLEQLINIQLDILSEAYKLKNQ